MSKYQRTKGHNWEREVASTMRQVFPAAKRGLGQARGGGREIADVVGTPFHIECKVGRAVSIPAAMRQACGDAYEGMPPVVVSKLDRQEPMATMLLSDWVKLCMAAYRRNEEGV